ncbi:MAG: hypothetical protein JNL42_00875 [Anaerolineae bacterium]|nr:hypothetical protein [Anaerolineae bacterium]
MYTLLRSVGFRTFLIQEAPYLTVAFLIASLYYKWGSFGAEALGFLATWFALSAVGNFVVDRVRGDRSQGAPPR